jgi:phage repressor protein C with HTH and peptisase S24 domain
MEVAMGAASTDLDHARLWAAIDTIAEHNGLSPSALARRAGLSSTAFNKSKRVTADGRPRWPSTESIAKILATTGADLGDLVRLIIGPTGEDGAGRPCVSFLSAQGPTRSGFAEDGAAPPIDAVQFLGRRDAGLFAHEVADEAAAPLYRRGDVLIASTSAPVRKGDRVLVHTADGAVTILRHVVRNSRSCTFVAPIGRRRRLRLACADVVWIARILWASQ